MEKCRICLGNKKNLRCIFDVRDNVSYAFMITSISDVKIMKDDGITDKICLGCRKKLNDVFDFKLMIEKSDAALQNIANHKKIKFNNLEDIKIKIEIAGHDEIVPKYENNIAEYFKDGEDSVFYNGTIIKKVEPCDSAPYNENGPLSVLDFLNTIKDGSDNDFDDNHNIDVDYEPVSNDDDDEYLLPLAMCKKLARKGKKKRKMAVTASKEHKKYKTTKLKSIKPIRPVFLNDIRVLPTKAKKKPTVPKKYYHSKKKEMCYHCGKMTKSLKSHILTHSGERKYKCDICGKGFLTNGSLGNHKRKHTDLKTIKCEHCVAAFSSQQALRSHMISHSEEKKYICDFCSKPFKRRSALERHKLMHNVTNKNIKCELCNMSFFTKYGLKHHMRVHTGERPYNCEICSQPYSYKHDFNRHCLKKHGVFLKRRYVKIMNEEVLKRERALMRDLMLKVHGFVSDGENVNPFEGPQGAQAFEMAVKALKAKQIPFDFNI